MVLFFQVRFYQLGRIAPLLVLRVKDHQGGLTVNTLSHQPEAAVTRFILCYILSKVHLRTYESSDIGPLLFQRYCLTGV